MVKALKMVLLLLGVFVLEHFLKLVILIVSGEIFDSCSIELSRSIVYSAWVAELVSPPAAFLVGFISANYIRSFWLAFVPVGVYFLSSLLDPSLFLITCGYSSPPYPSVIFNVLGVLIAYPGMTVGWARAARKTGAG